MTKPSKYDLIAREMLVGFGARSVVFLVQGGRLGNGCARAEFPAEPVELDERRAWLAKMLRAIADDVEKGITQPDQAEYRRGST